MLPTMHAVESVLGLPVKCRRMNESRGNPRKKNIVRLAVRIIEPHRGIAGVADREGQASRQAITEWAKARFLPKDLNNRWLKFWVNNSGIPEKYLIGDDEMPPDMWEHYEKQARIREETVPKPQRKPRSRKKK
jgi:hypothetical protein